MSIDGVRRNRADTGDVTVVSDEYTFTGDGVINPSRRYRDSFESFEERRDSAFSSFMDTPLRFFRSLTSGIISFFGTVTGAIQNAFIAVWSLTPFSSSSISESLASSTSLDVGLPTLTSRELLDAKKSVIENPSSGLCQKLAAFSEILELQADGSLTRESLQEELNTIFASDEFPNDLKRVVASFGVDALAARDATELIQFTDRDFPTFIIAFSKAVKLLPDRLFRKHEPSFLDTALPLHERLSHLLMSVTCSEFIHIILGRRLPSISLRMDRENYHAKQQEFLASNPVSANDTSLTTVVDIELDEDGNVDVLSSILPLLTSYPSMCLSFIDVCIQELEETPLNIGNCLPLEVLAGICSEDHCELETELTTDALKRQALKDCLLNPKLPHEVTDEIFLAIYINLERQNRRLQERDCIEIGKLSFERAELDSDVFNFVLERIRERS